ncbi:trypsin-like [Toxorhynchites rutilus septentrionalis]|uniref:trypsin-like n=1 Tax=Toxorhynchites rutilus septentrionalis TaxID=329112 RepID=UPI00247B0798|nr:trypsin-like [Toxorhynchites rutilus septentrionalis]
MKQFAFFFFFIAAVAAAPGRSYYELIPGGRVVGGILAEPHEFPYVVSVRLAVFNSHICGGTIINQDWILTAAHCITETFLRRFVIWAGAHNFAITEPSRQIRDVDRFSIHPDYRGGVNPSDIAVMHLSVSLVYTPHVNNILLPESGRHFSGTSTLVGWGSTSPTNIPSMPNILQKVEKPLLDYATGEQANGGSGNSPLAETNICTGPLTGGIAACSGDSGGPLLIRENGQRMQIGIVSWGWIPCGSVGRPSVYVGVSHYVDWVKDAIGAN